MSSTTTRLLQGAVPPLVALSHARWRWASELCSAHCGCLHVIALTNSVPMKLIKKVVISYWNLGFYSLFHSNAIFFRLGCSSPLLQGRGECIYYEQSISYTLTLIVCCLLLLGAPFPTLGQPGSPPSTWARRGDWGARLGDGTCSKCSLSYRYLTWAHWTQTLPQPLYGWGCQSIHSTSLPQFTTVF